MLRTMTACCTVCRELKQLGPLKVSPMGLGTWAWGNQFLWGYEKDQDAELQEVFNLMVSKGVDGGLRAHQNPHLF